MLFRDTILGAVATRGVSIAGTPSPVPRGEALSFWRRSYPADGGSYHRRMWWEGLSERGPIGQYAPSTAARKKRKGLPYDRVVLFETGELYARTEILPQGREFLVRASVPYAKYLVQRYGDRILWLGDDALRRWQGDLINELKLFIIKRLTNG